MDRIIALLAALVGLIALGGAILVNSHAETGQQRLAAQVADLQATLASPPAPTEVTPTAPAPAQRSGNDDGTAEALLALQNRIAALEETTRVQADALATAQAELAARPASDAPTRLAAADEPAATPATPTAVAADGPTTECVPMGTRFMGQAGDALPICKTHAVIKVASVTEGEAVLEGVGSVPAGGIHALEIAGCTVTVFSADSSGYAEMRVTCQ